MRDRRLAITLLLAGVIACASGRAEAEYTAHARVRCATAAGMSDWLDVSVTFVTGAELNVATKTTTHSENDRYAILYWTSDQASVVRLASPLTCGVSFERSCLPYSGQMSGKDGQGRSWEVCTARFCF